MEHLVYGIVFMVFFLVCIEFVYLFYYNHFMNKDFDGWNELKKELDNKNSFSICPAGWRIPKGGDKSNEANNEFWSLVVDGINGGIKPANYDSGAYPSYTGTPEGKDASTKLRSYPNNFLYSGFFYTSSANYRGSFGYYWSSTAYNSYNSYYLNLSSSYVIPGTFNSSKYYGRSIRCTVSSDLGLSELYP